MRWFFILLIVVLSGACRAPGQNPDPDSESMRIIVGFQAADTNPTGPELIERLQQTLGGEVVYLHALSGNAAVYRVTAPLDRTSLENRLKQLAGQAPIRYAEPDRRRRIQSSPTGNKQ